MNNNLQKSKICQEPPVIDWGMIEYNTTDEWFLTLRITPIKTAVLEHTEFHSTANP